MIQNGFLREVFFSPLFLTRSVFSNLCLEEYEQGWDSDRCSMKESSVDKSVRDWLAIQNHLVVRACACVCVHTCELKLWDRAEPCLVHMRWALEGGRDAVLSDLI